MHIVHGASRCIVIHSAVCHDTKTAESVYTPGQAVTSWQGGIEMMTLCACRTARACDSRS